MVSIRGAVRCVLVLELVLVSTVSTRAAAVDPVFGWGTATLIETDNAGGAFSPNLAMDLNGDAIAVWWQLNGSRSDIWANRFVPGLGWGNATLIETNDVGSARHPDVAMDSSGNAIAVWHQFNGTGWHEWANRFSVGSGWGTPSQIEHNAASAICCGWIYAPSVAMDPTGNAVAIWAQFDGTLTGFDLWANRFVTGSGWGNATLIDDAGGIGPRVAMDASGNAIATWYSGTGLGLVGIWANRFVPGQGWGTATVIGPGTEVGAIGPKVAIDPNGNAVVVWVQSDGAHVNVTANRFVPGTGWGTATPIENNEGDALFETAYVATDSHGNAVAIWEGHDSVGVRVWANRFVPGPGWGTPTLIELADVANPIPQEATRPGVAVDPDGNALAVWVQYDGTRYHVWANRFVLGSGWGTPTLIEAENPGFSGGGLFPDVAMDRNGNAVAVWHEHDGFRTNMWANRYVSDNVPPTLAITSPSSGTFFNVSSVNVAWTGSDAGLGLDHFTIRVDNDAPVSLPASATSYLIAALSEGVHTIYVTAYDGGGNSASDTVSVTVDAAPPDVSITAPLAGAAVATGTVQMNWTASDQTSGLDRFEVSIDAGAVTNLAATATNFTFRGLSDGPHTATLAAFDRAGHSRVLSLTFVVDTTSPTISITSPTADHILTSGSVLVAWTAADEASGIDQVAIRVDGGAATILDGSATSHTLTGLTDGSHAVTVTVIDRAGNSATSTVRFRVDTGIFSASGPYGSSLLIALFLMVILAMVGAAFMIRRRRGARPPESGA